jgi:hypothetical protein
MEFDGGDKGTNGRTERKNNFKFMDSCRFLLNNSIISISFTREVAEEVTLSRRFI